MARVRTAVSMVVRIHVVVWMCVRHVVGWMCVSHVVVVWMCGSRMDVGETRGCMGVCDPVHLWS